MIVSHFCFNTSNAYSSLPFSSPHSRNQRLRRHAARRLHREDEIISDHSQLHLLPILRKANTLSAHSTSHSPTTPTCNSDHAPHAAFSRLRGPQYRRLPSDTSASSAPRLLPRAAWGIGSTVACDKPRCKPATFSQRIPSNLPFRVVLAHALRRVAFQIDGLSGSEFRQNDVIMHQTDLSLRQIQLSAELL